MLSQLHVAEAEGQSAPAPVAAAGCRGSRHWWPSPLRRRRAQAAATYRKVQHCNQRRLKPGRSGASDSAMSAGKRQLRASGKSATLAGHMCDCVQRTITEKDARKRRSEDAPVAPGLAGRRAFAPAAHRRPRAAAAGAAASRLRARPLHASPGVSPKANLLDPRQSLACQQLVERLILATKQAYTRPMRPCINRTERRRVINDS